MSKRRLVDTNLIVRYLVQDHARHARESARLFEACDRGELELVILQAVIAECVFVLESFYKHPRGDISRVMAALLGSPGVEVAELGVYVDAFACYGRTTVHFVDCVIAATASARRLPVATFDADFKRFADVTVELG